MSAPLMRCILTIHEAVKKVVVVVFRPTTRTSAVRQKTRACIVGWLLNTLRSIEDISK